MTHPVDRAKTLQRGRSTVAGFHHRMQEAERRAQLAEDAGDHAQARIERELAASYREGLRAERAEISVLFGVAVKISLPWRRVA